MKFRTFTLIFFIFAGLFNVLLAQSVPVYPKKFHVDSLGRYYYHAYLSIYISISHAPGQAPTQLGRETGKPNQPLDKNGFPLDGHGKHYFHHNEGPGKPEDKIPVYADGVAPASNDAFLTAPRLFKGNIQYYGKDLTVKLFSIDDMSGTEGTFYSLNGENYQLYRDVLDKFSGEGHYTLKYYAVDKVGNAEEVKLRSFVVDLTAPQTYHHVIGINDKNVISVSTKIYLTATDERSGVAQTYYRIDDGPKIPYPGGLIPVAGLTEGNHSIIYYSTDGVSNIEKEKSIDFFLDKSAPIMSADILGDKFKVGNLYYFSGRTKLKLTAVDNKSGVKQILYSIDNEKYQSYSEPFYLPQKSGIHAIKYYSEDMTANSGIGNRIQSFDEMVHNAGAVYVDLTGPILNYAFAKPNFMKGDTMFISGNTPITFSATDPESGLQKLMYSIDNPSAELPYERPVTVGNSGFHRLYIIGYDQVNNRNRKEIICVADNEPPIVNHTFSVEPSGGAEGINVYPSYVKVFLAATDNLTDVKSITYRINDGKEIPYMGAFTGFVPNRNYSITVTATDGLGNVSKTEVKFRTDKY